MSSLKYRFLCALVLIGYRTGEAKSRGKGHGDFSNGLDSMSCVQGPKPVASQETELNPRDYWQEAWGRSGSSWPRRGFSECWANRGAVCALPDEEHVVCLPGSRRGSTLNNGWALDPRSQPCQPGVHCLYACEPGYYWTQFNRKEPSNYDPAYASKRGHCDGTWDYGTSTHGVYCDANGVIQKPHPGPLCKLGETYVFAENHLDTHVFLCQSVFPGHEIFLIPTLVKPGESVMLTTQPRSFWHEPSSSQPTHGDFYVSFAGADIMEACTWDEVSPSGASMLPYEIGTAVEDNGVVYSTHYLYQQPNSEVPSESVGYELDLECESDEKGVCGLVVHSGAIIKVDVMKKPRRGSTKVKFLFKKPSENKRRTFYRDPTVKYSEPATTTSPPYVVPVAGSRSSSGRKLKALESSSGAVYLENTIDESVILCQEGSEEMRGVSVLPGERIRLEDGSAFHLGRKKGTASSCDQPHELPWKLRTGIETSTGRRHGYSTYLHATNTEESVDYGLSIKCISEMENCRAIDATTVEVDTLVREDPTLSVTFTIHPFQLRPLHKS